jgi:hypothetical protein
MLRRKGIRIRNRESAIVSEGRHVASHRVKSLRAKGSTSRRRRYLRTRKADLGSWEGRLRSSRTRRRQRKQASDLAEVGRRLGHIKYIYYNIQVSLLITFHRFFIANYRVCLPPLRWRVVLQLGPPHRRCQNEHPEQLLLRVRTHLRRLDVDPCAPQRLDSTLRDDGPHTDALVTVFRSLKIRFISFSFANIYVDTT